MAISKYGNKRVAYDNHVFDSLAERDRYVVLRQMERNGEINRLRVHPRYELVEGFRDRYAKWHHGIYYEGDFEYWEDQRNLLVCEDVKGGKGTQTREFLIKKKLFLRKFCSMDLRIIGDERQKPVVVRAKGDA